MTGPLHTPDPVQFTPQSTATRLLRFLQPTSNQVLQLNPTGTSKPLCHGLCLPGSVSGTLSSGSFTGSSPSSEKMKTKSREAPPLPALHQPQHHSQRVHARWLHVLAPTHSSTLLQTGHVATTVPIPVLPLQHRQHQWPPGCEPLSLLEPGLPHHRCLHPVLVSVWEPCPHQRCSGTLYSTFFLFSTCFLNNLVDPNRPRSQTRAEAPSGSQAKTNSYLVMDSVDKCK